MSVWVASFARESPHRPPSSEFLRCFPGARPPSTEKPRAEDLPPLTLGGSARAFRSSICQHRESASSIDGTMTNPCFRNPKRGSDTRNHMKDWPRSVEKARKTDCYAEKTLRIPRREREGGSLRGCSSSLGEKSKEWGEADVPPREIKSLLLSPKIPIWLFVIWQHFNWYTPCVLVFSGEERSLHCHGRVGARTSRVRQCFYVRPEKTVQSSRENLAPRSTQPSHPARPDRPRRKGGPTLTDSVDSPPGFRGPRSSAKSHRES